MSAAVVLQTVQAVDTSGLLNTILAGLKILSNVPGAIKAIANLRETIKNLQQKKLPELSEDSPLAQLLKGEEERLRRLIKRYHEIEQQNEYDDLEKDKERKRIAAQACKLLRIMEEIFKTYIERFEELKRTFCDYAKKAEGKA